MILGGVLGGSWGLFVSFISEVSSLTSQKKMAFCSDVRKHALESLMGNLAEVQGGNLHTLQLKAGGCMSSRASMVPSCVPITGFLPLRAAGHPMREQSSEPLDQRLKVRS